MSPPADPLLESYARDGFAVVPGVVDAEFVAHAGRHVDWLLARHPHRRGEDLGHELVADDPCWLAIVGDDRLVDLAARFVGPDIALFASHYISKPPGDGRPVLWHQDAGYWPLEPMEVVSLWLALDPSTPASGCLRVVPGSHRAGVHQRRRRDDVDSVFGDQSDIDVDESAAVDVVLEPGDVEIHHPALLHASGPNRSARRRCGLTIRYIPTSTRIVEPGAASAFLLRGRPGVNTYADAPTHDPGRHFPMPTKA